MSYDEENGQPVGRWIDTQAGANAAEAETPAEPSDTEPAPEDLPEGDESVAASE